VEPSESGDGGYLMIRKSVTEPLFCIDVYLFGQLVFLNNRLSDLFTEKDNIQHNFQKKMQKIKT